MVRSVHHIADVVQEAGDPGQLHSAFVIAQGGEDLSGAFGYLGHMPEGMLGIAHSCQVPVGPSDVFPDNFIVLDAFKCYILQMSFLLSGWWSVILKSPAVFRCRYRSCGFLSQPYYNNKSLPCPVHSKNCYLEFT